MDELFLQVLAGLPNFAGFVILAYILNRFLFALLDLLKIVILAILADDKESIIGYIKASGQSKSVDG
jgi:hypothetical protein